MDNKCLSCYKPLEQSDSDFHKKCAKKFFDYLEIPIIDFKQVEIEELAKQIVIKSRAVTGVQPKLSLQIKKVYNESPRLTLVGLKGDFILKPQSKEYIQLPENEDLTMHLAELIGIKTAKHSLIRLSSGELAYITKRFDRNKGEKIAVEDFCQLTEKLTEHKYRGSIEKIGKTIDLYSNQSGFDKQRLFEIVLFSYLVGNTDMHLKNFSLIENKFNKIELSPAYDLLNTKLVLNEDKEESALTINGKRNRIQKSDFDILGNSLSINEKALNHIYKRFQKILPNWIDFIQKSFLSIENKEKYTEILKEKHHKIFNQQ